MKVFSKSFISPPSRFYWSSSSHYIFPRSRLSSRHSSKVVERTSTMCQDQSSPSSVHTRNHTMTKIDVSAATPSTSCSASVNVGPDPDLDTETSASKKRASIFDSLNQWQQFVLLTCTMFVFFGLHNILQEAMMRFEGFHGVMLGYMEVLGVTVCSYIERKYVAKEKTVVAPMASYPLLTACLLASSSLSNMSLNYINFPTKVVFRSCKLIPTMIIATIMNRRIFQSIEYAAAFAISIGLVVFAAADWKLAPNFNPIGLILVSLSVVADAILPNAQERIFGLGASRLEVTYFTNLFTLIAMTFTTGLTGDLIGVIQLARTNNGNLLTYMIVYTMISYVAISSFMTIVKKYGGVTAVLLGTARKGMTLILSFVLFPKEFSWLYALGATLVLGGLLVASLVKQFSKGNVQNKSEDKRTNHDDEREPLIESNNQERDVELGEEESAKK